MSVESTSKIFLLPEIHRDLVQARKRHDFIELHAKPGDIVLVEVAPPFYMINPEFFLETAGLKNEVWVMGWDSAEERNFDSGLLRQVDLKNLADPRNRLILPQLAAADRRRDEVLRRAIDVVSKFNRNIFVIAGKFHIESPTIQNWAENKDQVVLVEFPKTIDINLAVAKKHIKKITGAKEEKVYPEAQGPCVLRKVDFRYHRIHPNQLPRITFCTRVQKKLFRMASSTKAIADRFIISPASNVLGKVRRWCNSSYAANVLNLRHKNL